MELRPTSSLNGHKFHLLHPTRPLIVVVWADVATILMKLGYRLIDERESDELMKGLRDAEYMRASG